MTSAAAVLMLAGCATPAAQRSHEARISAIVADLDLDSVGAEHCAGWNRPSFPNDSGPTTFTIGFAGVDSRNAVIEQLVADGFESREPDPDSAPMDGGVSLDRGDADVYLSTISGPDDEDVITFDDGTTCTVPDDGLTLVIVQSD